VASARRPVQKPKPSCHGCRPGKPAVKASTPPAAPRHEERAAQAHTARTQVPRSREHN
jgi:hypothetical protein